MATTNFPTSLDTTSSLPNPGSGDFTTAPSHASQHDVENDALRAIEAKVGIGASTPTANKVLRATGTGTTAYAQVGLTTDVTGTLPVANGGTGITSLGSGVATFLGTPSSANLATAVTDETGTGLLVFNSSPTIVTPTIASFTNAQHTHSNAAGGGQLTASSAITPATITNALLSTAAGELGGAWQAWTPTLVGFSANPTGVYRWIQIGKIVYLSINQLTNGTSNSTTFTISLPVTAATVTNVQWSNTCQIVDNGSSSIGMCWISTSGTVLTIGNSGQGGLTASGNKRTLGLSIFYEAA